MNIFHLYFFLCCCSHWRWSVTQPITINVNIRSGQAGGSVGESLHSLDPLKIHLQDCRNRASVLTPGLGSWSIEFFLRLCKVFFGLTSLACPDPLNTCVIYREIIPHSFKLRPRPFSVFIHSAFYVNQPTKLSTRSLLNHEPTNYIIHLIIKSSDTIPRMFLSVIHLYKGLFIKSPVPVSLFP